MQNRNNFGVLLVSGVFALGAIGIAIFTQTSSGSPATQTRNNRDVPSLSFSAAPTNSGDSQKDTDGDGLPDWKELVYGTDPEKSDTDGDGVSDGDEVTAGTNPLNESNEPDEEYIAPRGLPPSTAIGRELFAAYTTLKTSGQLNDENLAVAFGNIIDRHGDVIEPNPNAYTLRDITIIQNEAPETLLEYRTRTDTVIKAAEKQIPEYDLIAVQNLIETGDLVHAQTLLGYALVYQSLVDSLLEVPTPESRAVTHLDLVNALSDAAYVVSMLGTSYTDPYVMLSAVNLFVEVEKNAQEKYIAFHELTPPREP